MFSLRTFLFFFGVSVSFLGFPRELLASSPPLLCGVLFSESSNQLYEPFHDQPSPRQVQLFIKNLLADKPVEYHGHQYLRSIAYVFEEINPSHLRMSVEVAPFTFYTMLMIVSSIHQIANSHHHHIEGPMVSTETTTRGITRDNVYRWLERSIYESRKRGSHTITPLLIVRVFHDMVENDLFFSGNDRDHLEWLKQMYKIIREHTVPRLLRDFARASEAEDLNEDSVSSLSSLPLSSSMGRLGYNPHSIEDAKALITRYQ